MEISSEGRVSLAEVMSTLVHRIAAMLCLVAFDPVDRPLRRRLGTRLQPEAPLRARVVQRVSKWLHWGAIVTSGVSLVGVSAFVAYKVTKEHWAHE